MSGTPPPPVDADGSIVTHRHDRVLEIRISRAAKYNGFTPRMAWDLAAAYTGFEADDEQWVAVLTAEGPHFTAGLQLSAWDITQPIFPADFVDPLGLGATRRRKPLVAAVHGICFTIGIELMLAADVVIAAEDTRFGQVEVKRGLMPYGGATIRMVERAGWGNAMRWLLTGDEFDAATALRLGFVQEVVPNGTAREQALALAQRIAAQAPLAVRATRASSELYVRQGESAAIAAFPEQLLEIARSEDFAEGVRSFAERRDGKYRGR
jgi:enoyl-CoA hydratase